MENKRWLYAGVGTIVLLFAGLVYAWSVISSPIAAYFPEWTKAALSMTFTICMSSFCIGGLVGGLSQKKINVKMNMIISGILFCAGFMIASRAETITTLYLGYGVMGGFASGFVYNGVMSCMTKWFKDKPGLISGVLLMGFGFGSFIIGKVYQAVTPAGVGVDAWRTTFFYFAIILVAVLVIGALIIKAPGADYVTPAPKEKKVKAVKEEGIEVGPAGMLKRVSFYLYFVWAILLTAAGLILLSQASGIVLEVNPTINPASIATVVGLISIANGIGRLITGVLFDNLGRRKTMFVVDFVWVIAIAILIAAIVTKSFPLVILAFVVSGLAYSGVTPMNSAFIGAFYGMKNYPVNYPIVNMNLLIASFGSTISGALFDATGSYMSTMFLMLGAVLVATVISIFIKRP